MNWRGDGEIKDFDENRRGSDKMTKTVFGVMPTGEAVEKVTLKGGGHEASIITFGLEAFIEKTKS